MAPVSSRVLPAPCTSGMVLVAGQCIKLTYEIVEQGTSSWSFGESLSLLVGQHPVGLSVAGVGVLALIFHRELLDRWSRSNPKKSPEQVRADLIAALKARLPQLNDISNRIDRIKARVAAIEDQLDSDVVAELTRKLPHVNHQQLLTSCAQCFAMYDIALHMLESPEITLEDARKRVEQFEGQLLSLDRDASNTSYATGLMEGQCNEPAISRHADFNDDERWR